MSRATSAGTGKPYGLERVCRVLGFPRSTIYASKDRESSNVVPLVAQRRGPKPKMPDAELLEAIRGDLAASPFTGEGHRKVWARLRILRDIRVSRTRVLRLMRENALLSPHRRPQGKSAQRDGTITISCRSAVAPAKPITIAKVASASWSKPSTRPVRSSSGSPGSGRRCP